MNNKQARKLRKIAYFEKTVKKKVYKTYLQLSHKDKQLFILTGVSRILNIKQKSDMTGRKDLP